MLIEDIKNALTAAGFKPAVMDENSSVLQEGFSISRGDRGRWAQIRYAEIKPDGLSPETISALNGYADAIFEAFRDNPDYAGDDFFVVLHPNTLRGVGSPHVYVGPRAHANLLI